MSNTKWTVVGNTLYLGGPGAPWIAFPGDAGTAQQIAIAHNAALAESDYATLRDAIIEQLDPSDDDIAEVAIPIRAIEDVRERAERAEASAAAKHEALDLAIAIIGDDMRYVGTADEKQLRAALADDTGQTLLAELTAARAVVEVVREYLADVTVFPFRLKQALREYDEVTKGATDAT